MLDINSLWVLLVIGSGAGGMLSSVVGYYGSDEQFNGRKFVAGVIRGFFAGTLALFTFINSAGTIVIGNEEFSLTQLLQSIPSLAVILAILAGYTGDSITNKFSKMLYSSKPENR